MKTLSVQGTNLSSISPKIVGEQHREQDNMHGPVALQLRDKSIASLPAPRCKKATGRGLAASICSFVVAARPLLHCGHVLCVPCSLNARLVVACSVHSVLAAMLPQGVDTSVCKYLVAFVCVGIFGIVRALEPKQEKATDDIYTYMFKNDLEAARRRQTEMTVVESQEEDAPWRILFFKPMSRRGHAAPKNAIDGNKAGAVLRAKVLLKHLMTHLSIH